MNSSNYILYLRANLPASPASTEGGIFRITVPIIELDHILTEKLQSLGISEWKLENAYTSANPFVKTKAVHLIDSLELHTGIYPTTLCFRHEKDLFKLVLKYGSIDNFLNYCIQDMPLGTFKVVSQQNFII